MIGKSLGYRRRGPVPVSAFANIPLPLGGVSTPLKIPFGLKKVLGTSLFCASECQPFLASTEHAWKAITDRSRRANAGMRSNKPSSRLVRRPLGRGAARRRPGGLGHGAVSAIVHQWPPTELRHKFVNVKVKK